MAFADDNKYKQGLDFSRVKAMVVRSYGRINIVPGTYKEFAIEMESRRLMLFSAWHAEEDSEIIGDSSEVIMFWLTEPRQPPEMATPF